MATISFELQPSTNVLVQSVRWIGLANGDVGSAFEAGWYNDRSVQVVGTFGAGGSVTLQGSNDGSTWATLTDPAGTNLTFTATGLKAVLALPKYVRPSVTAGDGTTDLDIHLFMRGQVK